MEEMLGFGNEETRGKIPESFIRALKLPFVSCPPDMRLVYGVIPHGCPTAHKKLNQVGNGQVGFVTTHMFLRFLEYELVAVKDCSDKGL